MDAPYLIQTRKFLSSHEMEIQWPVTIPVGIYLPTRGPTTCRPRPPRSTTGALPVAELREPAKHLPPARQNTGPSLTTLRTLTQRTSGLTDREKASLSPSHAPRRTLTADVSSRASQAFARAVRPGCTTRAGMPPQRGNYIQSTFVRGEPSWTGSKEAMRDTAKEASAKSTITG